MKIIKKYFKGKVILLQYKKYRDIRGVFSETYNKKELLKIGIKNNFVQDNQSQSKKKYTFRGIHLQIKPYEQAKLVRVISGSIIDYVVDLRKKSKTFGNKIEIKMNVDDNYLLYISEGFGHGFLTLKNNTIINYKVSKFYSLKHSATILFDDKKINLNLSKNIKSNLILSKKDKKGILLNEFKKNIYEIK